MTEKRFTSDGWKICEGEHHIGMIQASNLLNELYDENLQLKQQNDKLIRLIDDLDHEEMDRQMQEILNE